MPQRSPKRFVLAYEPEYAAHRDDDNVRRVTKLHLRLREPVLGPPMAPELAEPEELSVESDPQT